jgi:hypothetical protein
MSTTIRLVVSLATVLLVCLACDKRQEQPPVPPVEDPSGARYEKGVAPEQPAGHRQMLELLARVAEEARANNPYIGEGDAPELRSNLANLPEDPPDLRRWLFNRLLCKHEARLAHWEKAIDHCLAAYRELEIFYDEVPLSEAMDTIFQLGVAHLRLGFVQNSVSRHTPGTYILPLDSDGVHEVQEPARASLPYFREVLDRTTSELAQHNEARWLLNIAHMALGEYPDGVPQAYRIPPELFRSEEEFPRFEDIAPALGLDTFSLSGGVIADDFDNDGDLDLMVSTADLSLGIEYFQNNGDGTFTDRTLEAGLTDFISGQNIVQADYDNDGHLDVLVLRGAWWRAVGRHPNSLLRNNGDGTFTDVTFEAGLAEVHFPTQAGDWADYDNDGDLDLFLGNESGRWIRAPSQLFRNNGDGTFTDVAVEAGVENVRYAKSAKWGDYDGDRLPDLYVSNLGENNRLYHNNGDGTFTDVAPELDVTLPLGSFPSWFWDFDNDGALDIFCAGYGGPGLPPDVSDVAASYFGLPFGAELDRIYQGDGRGGFREVHAELNVKWVTLPMGANFGDIDYDGYPDYYLSTGYPYYEGIVPNVMMRNVEGKRFHDVTFAGRLGHIQKGHGIAFADLDEDGDQDIFAEMGGMWGGDGFYNSLFDNPGFGNHWLKVKLIGVRSNRSAIGARVRVEIVEDGRNRSVYRHVNSGGTFGANPLRQEIGLGRAKKIEMLEIYWPTSDTTQSFRDVPLDRTIEITEGEQAYRVAGPPTGSASPGQPDRAVRPDG